MAYIDGVLCAVPKANKEAYRANAEKMAALFKSWGALEVVETWGDEVPDGTLTSFPMAVKQEPGEAVVFSWIKWPSRAVRDAAHPKMMEDPKMQELMQAMPFDGARMLFGGFETIVEL